MRKACECLAGRIENFEYLPPKARHFFGCRLLRIYRAYAGIVGKCLVLGGGKRRKFSIFVLSIRKLCATANKCLVDFSFFFCVFLFFSTR